MYIHSNTAIDWGPRGGPLDCNCVLLAALKKIESKIEECFKRGVVRWVKEEEPTILTLLQIKFPPNPRTTTAAGVLPKSTVWNMPT